MNKLTTFGAFLLLMFASLVSEAQIGKKISAGSSDISGTWVCTINGQTLTLLLMDGGQGEFDGQSIRFVAAGEKLTISTGSGSTTYTCRVTGNSMTLSGGDLQKAVTFNRAGAGPVSNATMGGPPTSTSSNGKPPFLGDWISTENEHLTMMDGGRMKLEGYDLSYTYTDKSITVNAPNGKVVFEYELRGDQLAVATNGKVSLYQRAVRGASPSVGKAQPSGSGGIDRTMVGKWCYMNSSSGGYNSSGSYSSSQCFVLEADGTYAYSSGSSRSVDAGGSASQGEDRGTWSVQGSILIARSAVTGQVNQYPFQKRNNRNGDACIVVNGTEFVTYYNRPGW